MYHSFAIKTYKDFNNWLRLGRVKSSTDDHIFTDRSISLLSYSYS